MMYDQYTFEFQKLSLRFDPVILTRSFTSQRDPPSLFGHVGVVTLYCNTASVPPHFSTLIEERCTLFSFHIRVLTVEHVFPSYM